MARFFLFAYETHYPAGGAQDFIAAFDTVEEALSFDLPTVLKGETEYDYQYWLDWAHVAELVDGKRMRVLYRRKSHGIHPDAVWGDWVAVNEESKR